MRERGYGPADACGLGFIADVATFMNTTLPARRSCPVALADGAPDRPAGDRIPDRTPDRPVGDRAPDRPVGGRAPRSQVTTTIPRAARALPRRVPGAAMLKGRA